MWGGICKHGMVSMSASIDAVPTLYICANTACC
jgi:hypothetical protein